MRYFFAYLLISSLVFTPLLLAATPDAPKFNPNPSVEGGEDKFDHGKFREVKDAVKSAIEHVAKKLGGEEYNEGKMKAFVAETSKILESLRVEYPNIQYAVMGDNNINAALFVKGHMFLSTTVEYRDEKDSITWEFTTMFGPNMIDFYSTVMDGKPKTFEDYYHYNHLEKKVKTDDGHKDS